MEIISPDIFASYKIPLKIGASTCLMRNLALIKPQSAINNINKNKISECNLIEFDLLELIINMIKIANRTNAK